ncbi:hypothetical protein AWN76_013920 [Rhodothermaceae bacterium RA]|nr:hypothetical protein AWN76_013920 [Rhodothermaceae bacterium RA]
MNQHDHPALPAEIEERLQGHPPGARQRIAHLWQALGAAEDAPPAAPDTDAAWADLQARLSPAPPTPATGRAAAPAADRAPVRARPARRHATGRATGRTAGLALLALAMLAGLWGWMRPVTVTVPPGTRHHLDLPDGSRVELNSGSRLTYRRGFASLPGRPAEERRVSLHGEAFFDVVPDGRPFVVETFNARIDVLGTRFNVRAWPGPAQPETRVTLEEGRVRLTDPAGTSALVLSEPGQTARLTATGPAPVPAPVPAVPLPDALAWRQGGFVMNREPTPAVLAEVQRRFGVRIEVDDALTLADSTSLTYWRAAPVETVLHDFCLAQGCRYRRTSQGFRLIPAEPPLFSPDRR